MKATKTSVSLRENYRDFCCKKADSLLSPTELVEKEERHSRIAESLAQWSDSELQKPTTFQPGTIYKIMLMQERASRNMAIFVKGDVRLS